MKTKFNLAVLMGMLLIITPGSAWAQCTLSIASFNTSNPCYNDSNGYICPVVSGGTAPYTYSWNYGNSTDSCLTNLAGGSYTVTVSDAHSCVSIDSASITQGAAFYIDSFEVTQIYCSHNGSLCVRVSGGNGTDSFHWSNGESGSSCISNLTAGTYYATVTDANGCPVSDSASVGQISPPTIYSITTTNVLCYGEENGAACAMVAGGEPPYTYNWSNGATGQCVMGLAANQYSLGVVDAGNCAVVDNFSIDQPAPLAVTVTGTNTGCTNPTDGTITIAVSGGTPGYTYSIDGGATQAVNLFTGLPAGNYIAEIMDVNGCSDTAQISITDSAEVSLSVTYIHQIQCYGAEDDSITVAMNGGVPPYQYSSNGIVFQTENTFAGLPVGNYTITGRDANGCIAIYQYNVSEPPQLVIDTINVTDIYCQNNNTGEICAIVSGGTSPYTFLWNNGSDFACASGLSAGTYNVTVTDAHACTASETASVIHESSNLQIDSFAIINTVCDSSIGAVCAYVSGGTAPISYLWSTGEIVQCINNLSPGHYVLTVVDANGCSVSAVAIVTQNSSLAIDSFFVTNTACGSNNGAVCATVTGGVPPYFYQWNNGGTTACLSALGPDSYSLVVKDTTGCSVSGVAMVEQITSLTIDSVIGTNASCTSVTGSACVVVSGGTTPYTYLWSNNDTSSCITHLNPDGYWVTVTDVHGCTGYGYTDITFNTTLILDSLHVTNTSCSSNTGAICAVVSGGVQPYRYLWNNRDTSRCITGLGIGSYDFSVTDDSGCIARGYAYLNQNTTLTVDSFSVTNAACSSTGALCAYVSGGVLPYTFNWSDGQNTRCATGLIPGVYAVTVTDSLHCTADDGYDAVLQVSPLSDSLVVTNAGCGSSNGSICAVPLDGTAPYRYQWSNGDTGSCISSLAAANYSVTIFDANNCSAVSTTAIQQSSPPDITFAPASASVCLNGVVSVMATGGVTYAWSNGNSSAGDVLGMGTWEVTVTDTSGCTASASITIGQWPSINIQVSNPLANIVPDTVSFRISGGTMPYNILWGDGLSTDSSTGLATHTYTSGGLYVAAVTDTNGCSASYLVDAGCSDQCVWPGDANYDGIVNNLDLLSIGLGYDSTGYPRQNPTIQFIPQYCQNWPNTFLGGVNYKHADCNGDGIINALDTDAILLNYSLTHARGSSSVPWRSNSPALNITVSYDTAADGETEIATLSLGTAVEPATDVYALSFTFNYDPLVVDTGSVTMTYGSSWLYGPGDHIDITKIFNGPGEVQSAVTRINHQSRSGYGNIGAISMKITTGNINGKNLAYYLMRMSISNLTVIDSVGNILPFNEGYDSAQISFIPSDINPVSGNNRYLKIYPNPASEQLTIETSLADMNEISLLDLTGNVLIHQFPQANRQSVLNIAELSDGVYIIEVKAGGQEYYSRFVKAR